jgi:very-short-patch-repair endonuclease/ribosomal protein L37AE/L43A
MREQKNAYNNWKCTVCGNVFRTRALLQTHRKEQHSEIKMTSSFTDLISYDCPFCGRHRANVRRCAKSAHILHCSKNPDRVPKKGHKLSDEQKKLISEKMKKAHLEGRAGTFPSRKNCEHSYPEKWLIGVLNRELGFIEDKDYKTEYFFHKQFLDFAWPERKLCIEIDGQQHERFVERKLNDAKKDENLKAENWKLLRLRWSDICNNTQEYIQQILSFLK